MNWILREHLNDIIIYFKNESQHTKHVREILKTFIKVKLYVKRRNYKFNTYEMNFLSYVLISKKVTMKNFRMTIILLWLKLKNKRDVQMFIKFINFYNRFSHHFANRGLKLIKLLKIKKQLNKNWKKSWKQK